MAELETTESDASSCCSPAAQETCCEPKRRRVLRRPSRGRLRVQRRRGDRGSDVRESVRERYAAAAIAASGGADACCGDAAVITDEQRDAFGVGPLRAR